MRLVESQEIYDGHFKQQNNMCAAWQRNEANPHMFTVKSIPYRVPAAPVDSSWSRYLNWNSGQPQATQQVKKLHRNSGQSQVTQQGNKHLRPSFEFQLARAPGISHSIKQMPSPHRNGETIKMGIGGQKRSCTCDQLNEVSLALNRVFKIYFDGSSSDLIFTAVFLKFIQI